MAINIIVPKAGLTMTEATVATWFVSEGDVVKEDQVIVDLMTEKMTVEVVAPADGKIGSILKQEGEDVKVGETIAKLITDNSEVIEQNGETLDEKENFENKNDQVLEYDVAIIGSGPGGYVAAIRASQLGGKVVVIEREQLGGVCLNFGCIPTKTLLNGVQFIKLAEISKEFGVFYKKPKIEFTKLIEKKDSVVNQLQLGIKHLLQKNNVTVLKGTGKIISTHQIEVKQNDGTIDTIQAKNIILASGSEASIPNIPGLNEAKPITNKEALSSTMLPKRIAIIGAGAIGCEFASIYAPLGVNVTVIEAEAEILSSFDSDVSQYIRKSLEKDGVTFFTSSKITKVTTENGHKKLFVEHNQQKKELVVDEILIATGRKANIDCAKNLELNTKDGNIVVNEQLQTSKSSIYAIGDMTGIANLAHVASAQGIIAAENCMGLNSKIDYTAVPSCIYTSPEIASVGLTEKKALEKKIEFEVGKFYFNANGRALTNGNTDGFVKVIRGKKYDEILGVHIVGPHASELISEAVLAINLEATTEELISTIHPHPTLSEGLFEAALASMNKAIHS